MDLRTLRRRVRRNGDLPAPARLFFEDVCDMHAEKGCFAGDEWFARQYGVHEKTIERYRTALKKAGVLTWYEADGKRHMVPVMPADSRRASGDESAPQGQKRPSGTESSPPAEGQKYPPGDESVPQGTKMRGRFRPHTRVSNNTSLRDEHEGGGARVREDDPPEIAAFVEEVGRRPVIPGEYDEIVRAVDDVALFRKLCRQAYRNVRGDPHRVRLGYLLDDYESALEKQHAQSPEHDDRHDHASAGDRTQGESAGGAHSQYAGLIEQ